MMQGHTHVVRTTAAKLEADLNSWLNRPDDPSAAESTNYQCHHVGGRDWVIVLHHSDHPVGAHKETTPVVHVELYDGATEHSLAGLVEDEKASWILYFDNDGRPVNMWLRRDTSGAVVGEPITFSGAQVDTIPGWDINELRASVGKGHSRNDDDRGYVVSDVEPYLEACVENGQLLSTVARVEGAKVPFGAQYRKVYWVEPPTSDDIPDVTVHTVPGWFTSVWNALTERRPIDFEGQAIPEWLDAFLQSSLAMGTATGPAPIPLTELVTAGGRADADLPSKLINAASEINAHGYKASLPWVDVAGLLSQAGTLLAWYSDRSTEGAPYWVKHQPSE